MHADISDNMPVMMCWMRWNAVCVVSSEQCSSFTSPSSFIFITTETHDSNGSQQHCSDCAKRSFRIASYITFYRGHLTLSAAYYNLLPIRRTAPINPSQSGTFKPSPFKTYHVNHVTPPHKDMNRTSIALLPPHTIFPAPKRCRLYAMFIRSCTSLRNKPAQDPVSLKLQIGDIFRHCTMATAIRAITGFFTFKLKIVN